MRCCLAGFLIGGDAIVSKALRVLWHALGMEKVSFQPLRSVLAEINVMEMPAKHPKKQANSHWRNHF
jgi:hypothetical protein